MGNQKLEKKEDFLRSKEATPWLLQALVAWLVVLPDVRVRLSKTSHFEDPTVRASKRPSRVSGLPRCCKVWTWTHFHIHIRPCVRSTKLSMYVETYSATSESSQIKCLARGTCIVCLSVFIGLIEHFSVSTTTSGGVISTSNSRSTLITL